MTKLDAITASALVAEVERLTKQLADILDLIDIGPTRRERFLEATIAYDSKEINRLRAENDELRAQTDVPAGVFFAPEDIIIVRNAPGGEIIGYRYEPLGGEF